MIPNSQMEPSAVGYVEGLRSHYTPNGNHRDIASEAYDSARTFIQSELKSDNSTSALLHEHHHTIEDVHSLVAAARTRYEDVSKGRKARKWLGQFSARVSHYGRILDVLAQHQPEYVALAWGAMKFVFTSILNHADLIQEFSQALVYIGDALPQARLTTELYQTNDVRDAVSNLYSHILQFFQGAMIWYNRSRVGRAFSAIFSPYKLKYKDTVVQIQRCAASLDNMAIAKSRVELRDMHVSVELIRQEQLRSRDEQAKTMETLNQVLSVGLCNQTITKRIDVNVLDMAPRVHDLQFSRILSALKPQICPHETLDTLKTIVKRSKGLHSPAAEPKDVLHSFNRWFSKEGSSLFVLRVGPRAENKARMLTTDIITLLQRQEFKVIWRLSPPRVSPTSSEPSLGDLLKSLVHQALSENSSLLSASDLNVSKFQAVHSDIEWASLFRNLFARLPKCYIVIETHDLFQASDNTEWISGFLRLFQEVTCEASSKGNVLKFLVLCYGNPGAASVSTDAIGDIELTLRRPVVTPVRCRRMVKHRKGTKGWERVVPKL